MHESDPRPLATVDAVLLVLATSNMNRRALIVVGASMMLLVGACGAEAVDQAQVVSVTPTAVPTTAPLSVPTPTQDPARTPTTLPEVTSTSLPTSTVAPIALPTPTIDPAPSPTAASDAAPASTDGPTVTSAAEVVETPTPVPTPTAEEPETAEDAASSDSDSDPGSVSTPAAATPTAVVAASGEPPLECYDREVQVYRAHVDGVDALSFEGGRVYCSGAGTNAVSAARSYRHSSGLIVNRNADYIFNDAGSAYIPYSGSVHFCINGQPASEPVRADTVPALLLVIDNEAKRQLAQGAIGPAAFTGTGAQC